ncbi:MAG TPA: SpoIIE family protein phosphatase [Solirubrobacterales bacterium]|nr:SpoIIE family protein phosphatase [Solirubrobacterales bacterium]
MTPEGTSHEQRAPMAADEVIRLEDVQRVTESALAYLDLDDLLEELLDRVTDMLDADTAAVLLVEEGGRTLAARAAKGLEEEVERGFRLPVGRGFAGRVAFTREPVVIADLGDSPVQPVNPLFREKGVQSLLGVPLLVEGEVIGVLHVGSLVRREFNERDIELLQLVANRVALSIERSRLMVQGRIAATLQRSLLPRQLPQVPGLRMAARYLPAADESAVGGDWYDVIDLGGQSLGFMIGDVAGHGMAAATYMGQLRSAIRAYALDTEGPGEVITKLAEFSERMHSRMATVIYATLNLTTWEARIARAGHPYPLLIRSDGSAEFLSDAGGPPIGTVGGQSYDEQALTLDPGETLLLYTDGLIERRGQQLSDGEAALTEVAISAPDEPELKCQAIISALTKDATIADDIAILAVQTVGLHDLLEVKMPASPAQLMTSRHLIRRWVEANNGSDDDCAAFAIAVSEACANSIEHAYGPKDETIDVRASLVNGDATVTISDHGKWREPRGGNRGRGIPIMREFMDEVSVEPSEQGTTVRLTRRLREGK